MPGRDRRYRRQRARGDSAAQLSAARHGHQPPLRLGRRRSEHRPIWPLPDDDPRRPRDPRPFYACLPRLHVARCADRDPRFQRQRRTEPPLFRRSRRLCPASDRRRFRRRQSVREAQLDDPHLRRAAGRQKKSNQPYVHGGGVQPPAGEVHIDTEPSRQQRVAERIYARERPDGPGFKRFIISSFWRTFSPPPQDCPLALCDGRSVRDDEGTPNVLWVVDDIPQGEALFAPMDDAGNPIAAAIFRHNPDHRWWYFSNMTRDEPCSSSSMTATAPAPGACRTLLSGTIASRTRTRATASSAGPSPSSSERERRGLTFPSPLAGEDMKPCRCSD